jgi:hypothetical protein
MSILLMTIATGASYRSYAGDMMNSASTYWPEADRLVFTDKPGLAWGGHSIRTEAKGYPNETLYRYHTMLGAEDILSQYDHLFYADADMLFVDQVEDITTLGLVATQHPGYVGRPGTPETRKESTAYSPWQASEYFCGGFQGGDYFSYTSAMKSMRNRIDTDTRNGITAVWHDESHWNATLSMVPPAKILTPSYCYPEGYAGQYGWEPNRFRPIVVALDKSKRGNHWSQQ